MCTASAWSHINHLNYRLVNGYPYVYLLCYHFIVCSIATKHAPLHQFDDAGPI